MAVRRPCSPWVPYYDPEKTFEGYTLFAPQVGAVAWLIDMEGRFVHCWNMPYGSGGTCRLLPSGNLLYVGRDMNGPEAVVGGGGGGGMIFEADWEGNIVWEHKEPYQHHDVFRMDNGNTMVLGLVQVPDDITAKVKGGWRGAEPRRKMWTDFFREISPDGKTVWEWFAYEHLDIERDIICPLDGGGQWTHANSCFVMPNGDVLSSFHMLHSAVIIDKKTGEIKWRWGASEKENLGHPHDATLLENGNVLVFDNGVHRRPDRRHRVFSPNYSRVVEVNPNSREIVWEYLATPAHEFYSHFISSAQRLPNGNTLICEGSTARFFEVTKDKEIVWEFASPFYYFRTDHGWNKSVFRAYRYGADYEGLKGRSLNSERVELTLREKPYWREAIRLQRAGLLGY